MIFIMDVIPVLVDQNHHEARLKVTWWIMGKHLLRKDISGKPVDNASNLESRL